MTCTEADVPLRAPPLINLSAQTVAHHASILLTAKYAECPINDELAGPSSSPIHLPLPASTAIFQALRDQWTKSGVTEAEALERFTDGERLPLEDLSLTRAHLSDRLLANLVAAHQSRLKSLDISETQGILGHEFNRVLEERGVQLDSLNSLAMTSFEILRAPLTTTPPRRATANCTAACPCGTLPMLSEDDLVGSSIDINIDHYMDASDDDGVLNNCRSGPEASHSQEATQNSTVEIPTFTSRCPNVRSLSLHRKRKHSEDNESMNDFLGRVLHPLKRVELLDLSYWNRVEDLSCLETLALTTLILYDVPELYKALDVIIQLKTLQYLDLSQSQKETAVYPRPVTALNEIVTHLPCLTHLDISSTNLASQPSVNDRPFKGMGKINSDIFGLRMLEKPLEYLGLFNCDSASHFAEIPAKNIAGDKDENQILLALKMYSDRAGLLQVVLNECYQLYRFGHNLTRHSEALHLVLEAMQKHLEDSTLQIAGSASLFYIIRKVNMNRDTKRGVVTALLNGMDAHMEEQVMVRNCCLSLCQFEIPSEILFGYSRVARLLVAVLRHHNSDYLTQRIVVFLLNSMACHVEGEQKVQVGEIGAIEVILDQIRKKHASRQCDDVMEVGWSFLWNITDETPTNCERFLNADGLLLFHKCYQQFQSETELVRNMMGLIGNIAEVEDFRSRLMNDDYVNIFCDLLMALTDGIEISYNSAGVLAHMVSDGTEAWKNLTISRQEVMERIIKATETWDLSAKRYINYKSFKPILRLIPMFDSPASQHWAIWALANLTSTDKERYCAYVCNEGGLPLLELVEKDSRSSENMKKLAAVVLENIRECNVQGPVIEIPCRGKRAENGSTRNQKQSARKFERW
uniref:Zyg eleven-related protein 1 n=1 Tax=Syphacia muris TaxID=451379 RepID=A0A0N5AFQ0_9BILA